MLRLICISAILVLALAQEDDVPEVPAPFKALEKLCGDNIAPIACACASGGTFPNQQQDLVKCNPTECRCPGKQWEKFTIFGCENGGMPLCPEEQFGDAPWEVYTCTDGTAIDFEAVKASKLTGKCSCGEGGKPVCKSTQKPPLCPDGVEPSSAIGYIASFIKNCQ